MSKMFKKGKIWIAIIVIFIVFMFFFDSDSILNRLELKSDIRVLEEQRDYYLNRIEEDSTIIKRLDTDTYLEQYARENYLMKRDSDVVYIILDER